MDKNELKLEAYRQDLAQANERIADLRVEVTIAKQQLQELMTEVDELRQYRQQREMEEASDGLVEQAEAGTSEDT